MTAAMRQVLAAFDYFVLGYFLVLNGIYVVLTLLAIVGVQRSWRWSALGGHDDLFANPLTPGISVVIPAHDEEACILECARSVLELRYPELEVVIVDDGSSDSTFALLQDEFSLVEVRWAVASDLEVRGPIISVHVAGTGDPLIVVRKEAGGSRADALNAGLNVARKPLTCRLDADSVLDELALLRVVKPFVDDPEHVVAVGGVVRVANGSTVVAGRVVDPRMPRSWVGRIQVVEYLRSFLLGRTAWSRMGGLLIISGAFGVFRHDVLVEVGGFDADSIAEDFELVARMHNHLRHRRQPYRIVSVPEPVSWTEAPANLRSLASQRRRWTRGLAETIAKHRSMVGNPRCGAVGLLAFPYYVVFELFGTLLELFGLLAVAAGLALGIVDPRLALMVALVAVGCSVLLSMAAVTVEEYSFHRYGRAADLRAALLASILENLGYRQLHAWWRLQGLFAAVTHRRPEWHSPERHGFAEAARSS